MSTDNTRCAETSPCCAEPFIAVYTDDDKTQTDAKIAEYDAAAAQLEQDAKTLITDRARIVTEQVKIAAKIKKYTERAHLVTDQVAYADNYANIVINTKMQEILSEQLAKVDEKEHANREQILRLTNESPSFSFDAIGCDSRRHNCVTLTPSKAHIHSVASVKCNITNLNFEYDGIQFELSFCYGLGSHTSNTMYKRKFDAEQSATMLKLLSDAEKPEIHLAPLKVQAQVWKDTVDMFITSGRCILIQLVGCRFDVTRTHI